MRPLPPPIVKTAVAARSETDVQKSEHHTEIKKRDQKYIELNAAYSVTEITAAELSQHALAWWCREILEATGVIIQKIYKVRYISDPFQTETVKDDQEALKMITKISA